MGTELRIESGIVPPKHDKHKAYRSSEKGQQRNRKYNGLRHIQRGEEYVTREFVSWDGEGINLADGSHNYVLLANSDGDVINNREGIPTMDVLEMMIKHAGDKRIHVAYGFNYDVNMILRDLTREELTELYNTGALWWNRYRIDWRAGKSFTVYKNGQRVCIYDVLPFFQRSFVSACDEYLGTDWPHREQIIREKANRGSFDYERITEVSEYNNAELETLIRLCGELRERLNKVDIRVNRWDGPGAIASALYKKYGVKQSISETPEMVRKAAQWAYAGGRFEIIRKGHSDSKAYQYDIRSAYPSAMRNLPCLAHGTWRHNPRPTHIVPFGIYRVKSAGTRVSETRPQPFWHRNSNGTVYFTGDAHGWYWSPEAELAEPDELQEAWEYQTACECNPFSFVEGLYNKRAALKRAGDGAHIGLKLGLNSLYGKLAQQIGYEPGPPLRLPPYHCLEWAGYVTSHCRAQVYRASMLSPDNVIAFETDAVFTRVPLPVSIGERLGEWDQTEYENLTYLKSGMYWGDAWDKGTLKAVEKTRGINKGSIPRDLAIYELRNGQQKLPAEQTRFITLGQALHQNFDIWTHWVTSPRFISVALWGKRIDVFDSGDNFALKNDGWQETIPAEKDAEFSHPYEIAWEMQTDIANELGLSLRDVRNFDAHIDIEGILSVQ